MEFGLFFLMQRDEAWSEQAVYASALEQMLGEVHRVVQGEQAHAHAQAQRARAGGDVRGEHGRSRAEAVVVEVMLGDPHGVIAERLGGEHLCQRRVVDLALAPRVVPLHQEEEAEVHG